VWDVKAMQRLIVTSATYQQASQGTAALRERDPENRLLARGPRFRLPAEMVRDNALAASGLLNRTIGGPSVFPYQPPGLWEELSRGETFTAQEYHESSGPDLYRRSMYTFWKRTVPPAALTTFDAPDREKCTSRRLITNTPLQALVLLNDPIYVEAARVFAQNILQHGRDWNARIDWAFERAAGRTPVAEERSALSKLYGSNLAQFQRSPADARALIHEGEAPVANLPAAELAAMTTVARAILNMHETITRN
jgi:hypothetical protein